jgi:hypothetical protein
MGRKDLPVVGVITDQIPFILFLLFQSLILIPALIAISK